MSEIDMHGRKVAFVIYDAPTYFAGPAVNAARLLPSLQAQNIDAHALVLHRRGGSSIVDKLQRAGVTVHATNRPICTESAIRWILRCCERIQPDVFVPNLSVAAWFASRVIREAGIPTVGCHLSPDNFHEAMLDQFVLSSEEWALSGIACVDSATVSRLRSMRLRRTTVALLPPLAISTRWVAKQGPGPIKLVYVGRLVEKQKRIFDTIDSMAEALRRIPGSTATLVGHTGANLSASCIRERILKHNLGDRFVWVGTKRGDELCKLLAQHHVLVLLSDYEGTPGAVIDGMACGLVPVCLNISGGIQDLIENRVTGLLVENRSTDFVKSIVELQDNWQLRRKLGLRAKEHIDKRFANKIITEQWIQFFEQLLRSETRTRGRLFRNFPYILPEVKADLSSEDIRRIEYLRRGKIAASEILAVAVRQVRRIIPDQNRLSND